MAGNHLSSFRSNRKSSNFNASYTICISLQLDFLAGGGVKS